MYCSWEKSRTAGAQVGKLSAQLMPTPAFLTTLKYSKGLIWIGFGGLLLALLLNSLALTVRPGLTTFVIWFMQSLPILIFIPGLLKDHLRTHAWLCFVTLIYFIHGTLVAFSPERLLIGLLEDLSTVCLFTALVTYIHFYRKHYQVPL